MCGNERKGHGRSSKLTHSFFDGMPSVQNAVRFYNISVSKTQRIVNIYLTMTGLWKVILYADT